MRELIIVQAPTLHIVQEQTYIHFNAPTLVGGGGLTSLTPFFFTATQGQMQFTLSATPSVGIILLAINGAAQNQAKGDFTLSGAVITLNAGVDINDEVFGVYA
jgi:hypothetical protein